MFNEQFTTEQYQDELDHYPYYDSYASNPTDKVRWARLGFLFLTCFVSYIVGSVPVNPPLILFTCAGAMLGALLILRAWEMFILVFLIGTIDHLPMWLNPGMSTFTEPVLLKLTKDILAIGLLFAVIKIRPTIRRRFLITYVFFAIYIFLRALSDFGVIGLTGVMLRYMIFYPFLGMAYAGALDSIDKITKFFHIFVFAGIAVALFGFFEVADNYRTYYSGYINLGPINQRMVSTLGSPNNLALFLQLPFLYLLSGLFLKTTKGYKLFIPLFTVGIAMFLTFSRTSFVLGLTGVLCIAVMTRNFRAFGLTISMLILGIVALVFLYGGRQIGQLIGARVGTFIRFVSESTESGQIFLFGRGLGSGAISTAIGERIETVVTDNFYTGLLRQAGIIGLVLFISLWSHLTYLCVKVGRQIYSARTKRLYMTLMTWNIIFALYGMAFTAFTLYPPVLIYWISVFWILTLPELEVASSEELPNPDYYETDYDY